MIKVNEMDEDSIRRDLTFTIHKVEPLLKDKLPELSTEMFGLQRSANSDEPFEGDEDGQVDGAALADHAQLT